MRSATQHDNSWAKAWHKWALFNFEAITHYESRDSTSRGHHTVNPYIQPAVSGFFRSISLRRAHVQQDILRLLTLWFKYGGQHDVDLALSDGFLTLSIDTWLEVIPQVRLCYFSRSMDGPKSSPRRDFAIFGGAQILLAACLNFSHSSRDLARGDAIQQCKRRHFLANVAISLQTSPIPCKRRQSLTPCELARQIIARINTPEPRVKASIHDLLLRIGKEHPQALIYSLTVASKSASHARRGAAEQILEQMEAFAPLLVKQVWPQTVENIRLSSSVDDNPWSSRRRSRPLKMTVE